MIRATYQDERRQHLALIFCACSTKGGVTLPFQVPDSSGIGALTSPRPSNRDTAPETAPRRLKVRFPARRTQRRRRRIKIWQDVGSQAIDMGGGKTTLERRKHTCPLPYTLAQSEDDSYYARLRPRLIAPLGTNGKGRSRVSPSVDQWLWSMDPPSTAPDHQSTEH